MSHIKRLSVCCCGIACLFLVISICAAFENKSSSLQENIKNVTTSSDFVAHAFAGEDELELVEKYEANTESEFYKSFANEVFQLDSLQDLKVSSASGVVSFSICENSEINLNLIDESLVNNGWSLVESGNNSIKSFVKTSGDFTCLYESNTRIGDKTVVVVQVF
jgi:hypothetical protein